MCNEVAKLLGRETFRLAEAQARNKASHPDNRARVLEDTQRLIQAGLIDPKGLTAMVRKLAVQGVAFGPVCMDDITGDR